MKQFFLIILASFFFRQTFAQQKEKPKKLELPESLTITATEDSALLTFIITDANQIPEEGAFIKVIDVQTKEKKEGCTDSEGIWKTRLPKGASVIVVVEKGGKRFPFTEPIEIPDEEGNLELQQPLTIAVVPKFIRKYILENVYFETGKATLKPESEKGLQLLHKALSENPKMKVEIGGHTDDIGNDKANLKLSQERANAVKQYLIDKGIHAERLIAKGYGKYQPAFPNNSEENRQKNRRTEIKIIEE
ncbi:MAG: OmpA family protein [Cytophagales bacterium]|nr:OmpA family protein [Cytophagales bacterium]MDW8383395.1 OmpA family protein [Flammeovirgaceae bacterium]